MSDSTIRGLDIIASLDSVRDALVVHFANILAADSCFGGDHAAILKELIDDIVAGKESLMRPVPVLDDFAECPAVLPKAFIAPLSQNVTLDPPMNLGLLGIFPREIRDIIYEYALSAPCLDEKKCNCTSEAHRSANGIALLRVSGRVHNEALPYLYGTNLFGIACGYTGTNIEDDFNDIRTIWVDPRLYRCTCFDRQYLTCLPQNAVHLIKNLEIDFVNENMLYEYDEKCDFVACTDKYAYTIKNICTILQGCVQLQYLDISLSFACKHGDIDYMASLIEPIKLLRSVKEPNVTVFGYQISSNRNLQNLQEPRWHLSSDFEHYLKHLLMSPHGSLSPPTDGLEYFHDSFELCDTDLPKFVSEQIELDADEQIIIADDEELIPRYLRDVYGTDDLESLQGGLPVRWQTWLNSEHEESCDWFDSEL